MCFDRNRQAVARTQGFRPSGAHVDPVAAGREVVRKHRVYAASGAARVVSEPVCLFCPGQEHPLLCVVQFRFYELPVYVNASPRCKCFRCFCFGVEYIGDVRAADSLQAFRPVLHALFDLAQERAVCLEVERQFVVFFRGAFVLGLLG